MSAPESMGPDGAASGQGAMFAGADRAKTWAVRSSTRLLFGLREVDVYLYHRLEQILRPMLGLV